MNENCFDVVGCVAAVVIVDFVVVAVACAIFLHDLLVDFSKSFLVAIFDFDSDFLIAYYANLKILQSYLNVIRLKKNSKSWKHNFETSSITWKLHFELGNIGNNLNSSLLILKP